MTTTEQKQEMVLPSFFYAIASSESRQLISLDELQRIITLDAMTQARTEDYRKNMRISSELAHQTKVMMPGITTSVLMDGRGKELRNVVKTTQMIAVDIDKIPAEKMKEVVQKADADPHTMMRFITVSQRGLRIISRYLPIDDDEVTALELFDVIIRKAMSYYSKLLGVPADEQCVDITRMHTFHSGRIPAYPLYLQKSYGLERCLLYSRTRTWTSESGRFPFSLPHYVRSHQNS